MSRLSAVRARRVLQRLVLPSALGLLACSTACETTKAQGPSPAAAVDAKPGAESISTPDDFDVSAYKKRELDLNRDGSPDAYQYTKVEDGQDVVVRKEVDVNFDGRIDMVRTFDEQGKLAVEHIDQDFDGKIDVASIYTRGVLVRKEYDTNFDGKVDLWRYYNEGVIERRESDRNGDGKVDEWEYFENGELDRIGLDVDFDGEIDEWKRMQSQE